MAHAQAFFSAHVLELVVSEKCFLLLFIVIIELLTSMAWFDFRNWMNVALKDDYVEHVFFSVIEYI